MKAGNASYRTIDLLPKTIPVFPLSGALLLPGGQLPLNIFEPRYLQMFDEAISSNRVIGMVQPLGEPTLKEEISSSDIKLYQTGCVGRIVAYQESGDGRILVNLAGICRYQLLDEINDGREYRQFEVAYRGEDLDDNTVMDDNDRERLLTAFRAYLEANQMETDWDSVDETKTADLVNLLCMMSPYGPAEKQALLEAEDIKSRAETLIAITEIELAKNQDNPSGGLQ